MEPNNFVPQTPPQPTVPPQFMPPAPTTPVPVSPPPKPPIMQAPPPPPQAPKGSSWGTFFMILFVMVLIGAALCAGIWYGRSAPVAEESGVPSDIGLTPEPQPAQYTASSTATTTQAIFCGGIAGIACPAGYSCKLEGSYPDAGGTCIKN